MTTVIMLLTIIVGLILFTLIVLIHELGHFTMARIIGVRVEEFGLGLPPKISGKKIGETEYTLNWLPIGGFVRLAGEDEDPEMHHDTPTKEQKKYFWARSKKERSAILVAGVFMNFLLAVVIVTGLLIVGLDESTGHIKIDKIQEHSPASISHILPGDVVTRVTFSQGNETKSISPRIPTEMTAFTKKYQGKPLVLQIQRDKQQIEITVYTRVPQSKTEGPIGIAIVPDVMHLKFPWYQAPWESVKLNFVRARDSIVSLASLPSRLLQPSERAAATSEVSGPVGIFQIIGILLKVNPMALLNFASMLSLSLAIFNVLPIPALDGGRLAFVFLEKIMGKKVRPAFERSSHQIGMIILFILIFLVSINDVLRIAKGG
jgi:regulator of sigma E protease